MTALVPDAGCSPLSHAFVGDRIVPCLQTQASGNLSPEFTVSSGCILLLCTGAQTCGLPEWCCS